MVPRTSPSSPGYRVVRSRYPAVAPVDLPLHEAVLGRAAAYGDRPALIDARTGSTLGHARLDHLTRRLAREVIAYVASRVAPYKKVRRVEFVDHVPRATTGKILRRELRARERSSTAR
ncbi:hypothetical protein MUU72_31450 [Streptomyces sp. RS10V-4]|uniref:AMP-binding enzyme n=1 Tax=Streptomyces rhizoryzae TaxID=2932493 RepID=UPI0020054FA9|nr:hypothetical protein [Streptomyces rhizoryzae]MCK7627557.1 hypothetical protein [Streptomyces rhizoryzae]